MLNRALVDQLRRAARRGANTRELIAIVEALFDPRVGVLRVFAIKHIGEAFGLRLDEAMYIGASRKFEPARDGNSDEELDAITAAITADFRARERGLS